MAGLTQIKIQEFLRVPGSGSGYGYGYGDGDGFGDGFGSGSGSGYGDGDGFGDGIKSFNGFKLYDIDGLMTAILSISTKGSFAKGFTLYKDLSIKSCFIAKKNSMFAHGETLKEAFESLNNKLFKGLTENERIEAFLKEFNLIKSYKVVDFFIWHGKLTGSCEFGRNQFAKENNIDLQKDIMTVHQFINLTQNGYGSSIILKIKKIIEEKK